MPQYEDVYEPPLLDATFIDKIDDLIAELQNLSAPSATNVSVDATGMDVITATNAQGALKQLDTAVDSLDARLVQLASIPAATTPTPISVNGMFQIPSNVLNCRLIAVEARRYGEGNCSIFLKTSLLYFDNGFTLNVTPTEGYTLKCSTTGLLTLVSKSSRLGDPNIVVWGIL